MAKTKSTIANTYTVLKREGMGKFFSWKRMEGNLCVDKKDVVMGHLSELGKNLCGQKLSTVRRKLRKSGYKLILNN